VQAGLKREGPKEESAHRRENRGRVAWNGLGRVSGRGFGRSL